MFLKFILERARNSLAFSPKKRNPGAEALGFVGCSAKDAEVQQVGQVGTEHLTEDVGDRDG